MQPIQRIFIGFVVFCATLGAALGIFLYVSLIPHFGIIGDVAAGVVITALVCGAAMLASFTWHKIGSWSINRNVITVGDYLVYRDPKTGEFTHLSGIHHQMALPPPAQITVTEEPGISEDAVFQLHDKGMGLRDIATALHTNYSAVQKIYAEGRKH